MVQPTRSATPLQPPAAVISQVRTLLQGLAGMAGPSPSSQPAPLLSGMPRGGQAGQSIGDRMPRTDAQPLGSALPRASGHGGAAALGTSSASQPSSLNWFRGDSIRGVDREFIYQVGYCGWIFTCGVDKCIRARDVAGP